MNPSQELALLEELLDELIAGIQSVLQSGEVLNDDFLGMIAQELEATFSRIEELKGSVAQPGSVESLTSQIPQLDQGPFPSSNVNSFKYDPKNETLFVKFHGQENAETGPVYRYNNVPRNIYDVFSNGRVAPKTSGQNQYHRWIKGVTPSLGASLYSLIRNGGYPYQRMS